MRALSHAVAGACFVIATTAAPAYASESAAGGPALRQARAAWDKGALDTAEPLYREALEKGGLAPTDVLEGYVRLGSIRASNGKKDQAVAAFRAASILDSTFAVPTEAGPKGPAYAAQAKKDTAKIGSIQLSIKAPKEATSGKPFTVTASLDSAHIPIVAKIGLVARDGTSGKEVVAEAKPGESVELEVASDAHDAEREHPRARRCARPTGQPPRLRRGARARARERHCRSRSRQRHEGGVERLVVVVIDARRRQRRPQGRRLLVLAVALRHRRRRARERRHRRLLRHAPDGLRSSVGQVGVKAK